MIPGGVGKRSTSHGVVGWLAPAGTGPLIPIPPLITVVSIPPKSVVELLKVVVAVTFSNIKAEGKDECGVQFQDISR